MSFQHSPPGVPKTEIIAALPQGSNDSNNFVKEMEASSEAAARSSNGRFVNFCVDGVSAESRHVWMALCLFLSCKSNHTGSTDPNHNMKSWRYQIVAGGGIFGCTVGWYMVDSDLLRLAGVSMNLLRPQDFASDLMVLKLFSTDTMRSDAKS